MDTNGLQYHLEQVVSLVDTELGPGDDPINTYHKAEREGRLDQGAFNRARMALMMQLKSDPALEMFGETGVFWECQ